MESIEIKYDDAKVKLMNMENLEKKLAANEKNFLEKQNKICDLESENRQLNHRVSWFSFSLCFFRLLFLYYLNKY